MDNSGEFLHELLESGVQVVGQPMAGVESAAVGILIGTGARDEEAPRFGVSHFTEQMLFRGSEHMDAREISERFDSLGASYDSSAGLEMTLVSAMLLGDRLPIALDLLADCVRFPAFPDEAIENVRTLLLQEIRQREDRPAQKVMDLLRQRFFQGSPLGHDVLGTEDSVGSLDRAALQSYWADRYTSNNMLISVAGNFQWEQLLDQLGTITADWPVGRGRMVVHEPQPQSSIRVVPKEAAQENIGFAFPGVPVTDPHYYATALFSQSLGGSSNSRLFQEVREKRGLAYAVQARFDGLEKTGLVRVYVGTSAERAHESVEVVMDELRKVEQEGITEEELGLSKTRLKSQLIMRSESTMARMSANMRTWWFEQKLYSLDEIRERIDAVTVEEIKSLVQSLGITSTITVVALGPRSEDELFGRVVAQSQ
jgi:predicted Zn-dependent peptidase